MKDFIKNNRLAKLAIFIVLASAIFASCKNISIHENSGDEEYSQVSINVQDSKAQERMVGPDITGEFRNVTQWRIVFINHDSTGNNFDFTVSANAVSSRVVVKGTYDVTVTGSYTNSADNTTVNFGCEKTVEIKNDAEELNFTVTYKSDGKSTGNFEYTITNCPADGVIGYLTKLDAPDVKYSFEADSPSDTDNGVFNLGKTSVPTGYYEFSYKVITTLSDGTSEISSDVYKPFDNIVHIVENRTTTGSSNFEEDERTEIFYATNDASKAKAANNGKTPLSPLTLNQIYSKIGAKDGSTFEVHCDYADFILNNKIKSVLGAKGDCGIKLYDKSANLAVKIQKKNENIQYDFYECSSATFDASDNSDKEFRIAYMQDSDSTGLTATLQNGAYINIKECEDQNHDFFIQCEDFSAYTAEPFFISNANIEKSILPLTKDYILICMEDEGSYKYVVKHL